MPRPYLDPEEPTFLNGLLLDKEIIIRNPNKEGSVRVQVSAKPWFATRDELDVRIWGPPRLEVVWSCNV